MSYGMIVTVQAPAEVYHSAHGAVLESLGNGKAEGMLCHIGRAVDGGFEILEVWESKEAAGRFNDEVVLPAMVRAGIALPDPPPPWTEFEPLDVMINGVSELAGHRQPPSTG